MRLQEILARIPARPGRRALSFDEVVTSRRPAIFRESRGLLLYLDDSVFILHDGHTPLDLGAPTTLLDLGTLGCAAGTGWRHDLGCDSDYCAEQARAA